MSKVIYIGNHQNQFEIIQPNVFRNRPYTTKSNINTPINTYIELLLSTLLLRGGQDIYFEAPTFLFTIIVPFRAPIFISTYLNSYTNYGFYIFLGRLLSARFLFLASLSLIDPQPPSELVIKEITPNSIVRTFQADVHYSLWKFVKLVQIGLFVQNRPLYVKNFN